jgi:hypothetical protein
MITMPFEPCAPVFPHGRVGSRTLLWPGGPPSAVGHGGRGFCTFPSAGVGVGVGRVVGRAICAGVAVGRGVGAGEAVGRGVGPPAWPRVGGVAIGTIGAGVGVGPSATIGPLGVVLPDGSADAVSGGDSPGWDGVDPGDSVAPPGVDGLDRGGWAVSAEPGSTLADGVALPPAISRFDGVCATSPAVSATVARTRLRSPIATTRRAR